MIERKRKRKRGTERMGSEGKIWKETGGEVEYLARVAEEDRRQREILNGLKPCCMCGEEAKAIVFGLEDQGIWIGCDRSEVCRRYIEIHSEGWSLEECAEEWNKYNGGWRKYVRRIKGWVRSKVGMDARYARKIKKEKSRKEAAEREKRREVFGIKEGKKSWFRKIFRKKGK